MTRSTDLYERALTLIPGGTQLLSKRPELFLPGQWPAYYRTARGVHVTDLDDRTYVDVSHHSVGACILGYADPEVEEAVVAAVRSGSMCTLSCPEEVELAELLCELHPWAGGVRYTRGGGEAMAVAVRIARAATSRDVVAFAGYHGWHDWYLAANLADRAGLDGHLLPEISPSGVPSTLSGSVVPFEHGSVEALDRVVRDVGSRLAAIVVEPARYSLPQPGYLRAVKDAAARVGAVCLFDEITSGFRMAPGGIHTVLGVEPDVAVFAKAMSNGYPMGAVIGRREVMEAVTRTFISSTYWTERIGPAAALATIRKIRRDDVPGHVADIGTRMRRGWEDRAARHGLSIATKGVAPLPSFSLQHGDASRALSTLYTQAMLDRGYLAAGAFYASFAHDASLVDQALDATDQAFGELRAALDDGDVIGRLRGPVAYAGLRNTRGP